MLRLFSKHPSIFVQIAAYRDTECQWTIKDMFQKAAHPERIHAGICWQFDEEADKNCFVEPYPRPKQVKEIKVKAIDSKGVCWARHQAQSLYDNEDYVLMIDSHMRFVEGWDEKVIALWKKCENNHAVLSSYPPGYKPPDKLVLGTKPTVQRLQPPTSNGDIRGDGIVLAETPPHPLRGAFLACGFVFAPGKLIKEVPYDPYLYFNQEEITLAARYFTHGWDVFHPNETIVYHYYKTADDPENTHRLHWEDNKDWGAMQQLGRQRFHHMVGHKLSSDADVLRDLEKYSLGNKRSLQEFEEFSGVNFRDMTVSEKALKASFIDIPKPAAPMPTKTPAATGLIAKTPLTIGHFIPPFTLPDSEGTMREIQLYGGKRTVIFFLPANFADYINEFFALWREKAPAFQQADCHHLFIVQSTIEQTKTLKSQAGFDSLFLADDQGALCSAFGWKTNIDRQPLSVLLGANQKILTLISERNASNHMGDLQRAIQLQLPQQQAYLISQIHAPVIIVPDAISEDLRLELLTYWENGKQYQGTIGDGADAKVVASGKRRVDANVETREFLTRIDEHLSKSTFPELQKVACFQALFRERYKIGCYEAADQGYYHQHRDTGVPGLAHRRYSLIIALTDDYEGGYLGFPEYGGAHYRPAARSAILFPSSLLHGVTPVTKGRRFIVASFLHGEAEETFRKQQILARGETYNRDDVRMLCADHFDALKLSDYFYTRTS